MQTVDFQKPELSNELIREWFNGFMENISVDQIMMETNTAPSEKEAFYYNAITKNHDATNSFLRVQSSTYFLRRLIEFYLRQLKGFNVSPQSIAFDLSDAKVLVWSQVSNDDEKTEDALILSEAKANSKYYDNGFYISSTIVEERDCLQIPPHYHQFDLNGKLSISR